MKLLENDIIKLRALESSDLDLLFSIENDSRFWEVSSTLTPYSRDLLNEYLKNSHQDIYEAKQLRLVICTKADKLIIGLLDLFDFNPQHERAGVGIIVLNKYQGKGFAKSALELFIRYSFEHLDLKQLYANIPTDNEKSQILFRKLKFEEIGVKKGWIKTKGIFKDVALLQLINQNHL